VISVDWTIWTALIVSALAVLAGLGYLGVRVLQCWRALKRFRRHLGKEFAQLADAGERTAEAAAKATHTTELEQSLSRLRVTLARFAVLREALNEATGAVGRLASVYPRK
jgi:uncharacterized membrane protein YcjF (UPF0283 family)